MKRIITIISSLLILTVFSSCSNTQTIEEPKDTDPLQVYSSAIEKSKNATAYDMDMNIKMSMSINEEVSDITYTAKTLADISDSANPAFLVTGSMNMPVVGKIAMNEIYKDGYLYMEAAGTKFKAKLDLTTATKMFGNNVTTNFNAEDLINITAKKDGTDTVINFGLNSDFDNSSLTDIFGTMIGESGVTGYEFKDIAGKAVIDESANFKSITITMKASYEIDSQVTEMDITLDTTVNSINQPITINAPDDADIYTEVDAETLGVTAA